MQSLIPLNLPNYPLKLSKVEGQIFVFDEIRKKKILLTPEEWVRQHFIHYLIQEKKVPKTYIGVENGLLVHELEKRTDIIVSSKFGDRIALVECKSPKIKLSPQVMNQAITYNRFHQCKWLLLTNGLQHIYARQCLTGFHFEHILPEFDQW